MAGLQRSAVSFRRQGSSGLVWDDRFISGELGQKQENEQDKQETKLEREVKPSLSIQTVERSRSNGGQRYRTGKVSPAIEPPSPKVAACGFCGAFGKQGNTRREKVGNRRSR